MMKKMALFLFALGMGTSVAYARLPDCEWNCYLKYRACVQTSSTTCQAQRDICDGNCEF